eukprot:GEMP01001196.1.p1 GENE.GEMP01001196.1~~GEMP01001196.1.p1  ORF type:complete len:859 (+),score=166.19 GEMP01001196.1:66-2579(+)
MHNAAGRYAGSKISLITTSDVRYEGVLCSLNAEETALSVQSVRSFGTEGRKTPEVPKSNEIYDFILFFNKDLKMVTIFEDNGAKILEFTVSHDPPGIFSPLTRGNGNPSLTDTTDDSGPSSASSGSLLTPLFPSDGNTAPFGGGLGFGSYPGATDFLHRPVDLPHIQNIQPHHPAAHLMFSPQQMQQRQLLSHQDSNSSGNTISLNALGTQHDLTNPSWASGHPGHNGTNTITSHKMAESPFVFSSGSTQAYANNSSTHTTALQQNNAIATFALDGNAPNYIPMAHCTQPAPADLTGNGNGHYSAANGHYSATNDHTNHNSNLLLFQHLNAYNGASPTLSPFPLGNSSLAVGMNGSFGQPSMSNGGSTACGPVGTGQTAGNAFGLSVRGAVSTANGNAVSTGNGNAFSSTVGFDCAASQRAEWESGAFAREVQKMQSQPSHTLSATQISLGNSLWRSHSAPESPVVEKAREKQVGKPLGPNDKRRYSDDDRVEEKQPPPHPPVSLSVESSSVQQSRETPAQAPAQANRRSNNRNAQRDAQIASNNTRPNGHTAHSTNTRGNSATQPTNNSNTQNSTNASTANGRNNTKEAFQATKQPKTIKDVFQLHKQAEEVLLDAARSRGLQSLSSRELRQLSESHSCVYHFFLDFVNYCRHGPSLTSTHWASSDEQHWDQCSRGLKKYFESDCSVKAHRTENSNATNNRSQHHEKKEVGAGRGFTLGDFTVEKSKKATRNNKNAKTASTNGVDTAVKVSPLPQKKALLAKSEPHEPPAVSKAPPARARAKAAVTPPVKVVESGSQSWSCPRCTLRNVQSDFHCGACGCTRDYANFVVDFPPLRQ